MTLVTEKSVKLLLYVRARASKKSILAFITITLSVKMMNLQNPHFYSPPHQKSPPQKLPLQPMWRFLSNNVLFSLKQRIVFSQTTCRFLSSAMSKFINSYLCLLYGIVGCSAVIEGRSNSIGCYGLCSIKR